MGAPDEGEARRREGARAVSIEDKPALVRAVTLRADPRRSGEIEALLREKLERREALEAKAKGAPTA